MFAAWGRTMVRMRWVVIATALATTVAGLIWGSGALEAMTVGGDYDVPGPASTAAGRVEDRFGNQDIDVLVLYSSDARTVDDPAFGDAVDTALGRLRNRPEVAEVYSYYDTGQRELVSRDGHATYALVRLTATTDEGKLDQLDEVRAAIPADGLRSQLGGPCAFEDEGNDQVAADLKRAELLSLPVLLVLLILIFGGLVAASTPLMIGGLAVLSALLATRFITFFTDMSIFAINIITLVGLGLAIDYALFIVSRFREELASGRSTPVAIEHTLATAGRTIATSGLIVMLALGSLLVFPQLLLRSLALGGMAAVGLAMVAALTVLPATLALLGPRINALPVPLPWHRARGRRPRAEGGWARVANSVMRRPWWYCTAILLVLGALAIPFHRAEFGAVDERILPASAESRQVADRLAADFVGASSSPITVLLTGVRDEAAVAAVIERATALPHVTAATPTAAEGDAALLSVSYRGQTGDRTTRDTVDALRDLPTPAGVRISVAGMSADLVDSLDNLASRLPWMLLLVVVVLFALLLLAFGSVLLPVQAILTTVVSVGASFGVMVWVFQDGHLESPLGFTSTGALDPDTMVLMLAVLFGLSTDYEVFLLSRVREQRDAGRDTTEAVALGLQRVGGIITSAALLLVVVVGGFTAGGLLLIKMLGVGIIVAITLDAALVRPLLVPAVLRLLGRASWWAPGRLGRLYRRYGIPESEQRPARQRTSPHVRTPTSSRRTS
ncbi:MAG: MMPL family transporter [Dactylosporangium sp.]|nr:MMPL family transporter [Dactylosporangium sp.]NNJ60945.1 MMPL family transporter [Dactylosporangium sp.]